MININSRLSIIKKLLAEETEQSLTYAALECRLTIELICYERLLVSYDYISYKDLRNWTPKYVIEKIVEEVNEHASTSLTYSISDMPIEKGKEPKTQEDYKKFNYLKIGSQSGFSIKKLNSLYQALSKIALHVHLPTEKSDCLSAYPEQNMIKEKITETIKELEKIGEGNLLSSGIGAVYSFNCIGCGTSIKKNASLLKDAQVVSCILPDCPESYEIHKNNDEILYSQRIKILSCDNCKEENIIATNKLEELRKEKPLIISCSNCNENIIIELVPCKRSINTPA